MSKKLFAEDLWNQITKEVSSLINDDKSLESFFKRNILDFTNIKDSIAFIISNKLSSDDLSLDDINSNIEEAVSDKKIILALEKDINAIFFKDPACNYFFQPLLFFKGFHSIQSYRVANYWRDKKLALSLYIQSKISEMFNVDIHPNCKIGSGIMIDHASGVVIGETAEVGDNCSIFHGVTLGGIGSEKSKRHPKVGEGTLLSANSIILGNITIGDNVKIGAGSVVLENIPDNSTAVGIPAKVIN